jgi:outer membrane immunogenic protein
MRNLLLATAVAVIVSAPAFAADLPAPEPEPVVVLPFTWTGFYIGGHAGYGWGDEDDDLDNNFPPGSNPNPPGPDPDPDPDPDPHPPHCDYSSKCGSHVTNKADSFDVNGFLIGAHAGYNFQYGSWVFGVEGDVDWNGADGDNDFEAVGDVDAEGTLSLDVNWQASLRARAGYAFDRFLVYGTGGLAFASADLEFNGTIDDDRFDASDDQSFVGWTIGVGAEYAFTDNLLGRLELRYTDFGDQDFDLRETSVNVDWNQTAVLVGLSYKF